MTPYFSRWFFFFLLPHTMSQTEHPTPEPFYGPFSGPPTGHQFYIGVCPVGVELGNPLLFWQNQSNDFPVLSHVARKYLVAVESMFTITGLIMNSRCSRLQPCKLNYVFYSWQYWLLNFRNFQLLFNILFVNSDVYVTVSEMLQFKMHYNVVQKFAFTLIGRPFVKRFALCYRSVVCPVCLWCWCIVAKRFDGSRRNLACR